MKEHIEWRDVAGYEGLYKISSDGQLWSMERTIYKRMYGGGISGYKRKGRIIQGDWAVGYRQYELSKDGKKERIKAHRMVAIAFIPNPLGLPVVNHIDSNPANNSVSNLEWCTYSANTIHAVKAGRHRGLSNIPENKRRRFGADNNKTKLTADQVVIVRASTLNNAQLGRIYGVTRAAIRKIKIGENWK